MRVVIVEDNATNLAVLCGIVRKMPGVSCEGFADPRLALENTRANEADLMIVDYRMPFLNGIDLVRASRALPSHAHVPIIMITADGDRKTRLAAVEAGVTDFLAKPIDPIELRSRVTNLLQLKGAQNALARRAEDLCREVEKATLHLQRREEEVIQRLARAIEFRDNETRDHVARVAAIARIIAEELGQSRAFVRTLFLAAPLHDIGKIGVPDAILGKSGKLDADEILAMRKHVEVGEQILANGDSDLIQVAAAVAGSHHERWDGSGYPRRLKGSNIPLAGRITAVADVFDALCSVRPYKPAWPIEAARAEIVACSGSHFDPACVEAFERGWSRIAPLYTAQAASVST